MFSIRSHHIFCLAAAMATTNALAAPADDFLLVRDDLKIETVELAEISNTQIVVLDDARKWRSIPAEECVALIATQTQSNRRPRGMLRLADGRQLPGRAIVNSTGDEETLAWEHPWLGRIDAPLEMIRSVRFTNRVELPPAGQSDTVLLNNGDVLSGLLLSLTEPIEIELAPATPDAEPTIVQAPLNRIAAIVLITPDQPSSGRRVWFDDGTVLDIQSLYLGDDGIARFQSPWGGASATELQVNVDDIEAVLFQQNVLRPLSELRPTRIEGPESRYVLPDPKVLADDAPLELSPIMMQGPIVVRYALPPGATQFAAKAELPKSARQWGDYELAVYDNDREVFRTTLNAEHAAADINVALDGSELTIQLRPGRNGVVQDQLNLRQAMLLIEN